MKKFLIALTLAASIPSVGHAHGGMHEIDVWKSPTCGCCTKWIEHLRDAGFDVVAHNTNKVDVVRAKLSLPDRYSSCHVAKIGRYAIEGHVPASDIKRLLEERPMAIGLAVPGMPMGSPGMEGPRSKPYQTLLIGHGGKAKIFAEH